MADDLVPLTPVAATRPKPRVRWRRLRRLGVALVLLAALVWFAPLIVAGTGLVNSLAARALTDFDGTVRVGGSSLGWLSPVELRDVTVTDPQGRTLLAAPRVVSSKSLLALARDRSDLGTFTAENPTAEVVCEQGTTNLERALARLLNAPPSGGGRPAVSVKVTGGTLVVRDADRNAAHTLTAVDADATIPADPTAPVTVRVRSETGKLAADLSFGSELSGTLTAADFPLAAVEPFARRAEPGLTLAGRLTADLAAGFTPAGPRANGTVAVADLVLTLPQLGPDPLRMAKLDLPLSGKLTGTELSLEKFTITCDLGRASLTGTLDLGEPVEKWLDRPGIKAEADADVAAVAAKLPRLLHVRPGLELREGRVKAALESTAGPNGVTWAGAVVASAVRGTRDGRPVAWEKPLSVRFAGRLGPARVPAFDRLDVESEFGSVTARGNPEQFTATAALRLDELAAKLGEFVDLGGVALGGSAKADLTVRPGPAPDTKTVRGTVRLTNFVLADAARRLAEPDLVFDLTADGRFDPASVRLDAARASLTAGTDRLDLRLLGQVADAASLSSGAVAADLSGDLARWRDRAARMAPVPAGWKLVGTGNFAGTVRFDPARIAFEKVTGELSQLKFAGAGVTLDEPQVKLYPTDATIDRATGRVDVGELTAASQTVGLATKKVTLTPTADGYAVACTVLANANLARVQRALGLQSDPRGADAVAGMVRSGEVTLDTAGRKVRFKANLPVENFAYGPPARPTWAEPKLSLAAEGEYDPAADAVRFTVAKVERPDGLSASAAGSFAKLSTTQEIELDGKLTYDLAALEPQLKTYLGQGVKVTGKSTRDFRLRGPLSNPSGGLSGSAAVGWETVRAYGFDVGKADLTAKLDNGTVTVNPVEAAFGQTGKVRLEPTVRFLPAGGELTFARGKVIDRAKLTPAACADALGYALPAIAKSTSAEGLVSFDLDDNRVPLGDPDRATVKGKLTLHDVKVGPGPVVTEIAGLLGTKLTAVTLANEQVVPVRLENGRVHHEGLALTANGYTVKTTGSVGLDSSLSMTAEVPVPDSAVAAALKNNPKIREAVAKKRLLVPVGGTIDKPKVDARAFQDALRKFTEEVARDAAKGKLNDVIEKGRDKLEQELEKKLFPKKPPE